MTDSHLNYVLTLNDNINNSKEYSPKSITSNSNFFTEKTQNNLNTSDNDLAMQSHRITESIKNIMNSNNNLNLPPDLGNYYNTISFLKNDQNRNFESSKNKVMTSKKIEKSDSKGSKNSKFIDNKKISFKNCEDIPIVTGELINNKNINKKNTNNNGKKGSLLIQNNTKKDILINKKLQYSQKTIGNKTEQSIITSNYNNFLFPL